VTHDPNDNAETFNPVLPKNLNSMFLGSNLGAAFVPIMLAISSFVGADLLSVLSHMERLRGLNTFYCVKTLCSKRKDPKDAERFIGSYASTTLHFAPFRPN
jgi:hypothetical protein